MSIKNITELEVISSEENVTGEEQVLMLQNGETKLIPMNFIKGSGSEMLIVDISGFTSLDYYHSTDIGDSIKEAVENGVPVCLYKNGVYHYPLYCKKSTVSPTSGVNLSAIDIGFMDVNGSNTVIKAFSATITSEE